MLFLFVLLYVGIPAHYVKCIFQCKKKREKRHTQAVSTNYVNSDKYTYIFMLKIMHRMDFGLSGGYVIILENVLVIL